MDEHTQIAERSATEVFMLVKIDAGDRQPYTPFSGRCGCGCGGSPGSCCCTR